MKKIVPILFLLGVLCGNAQNLLTGGLTVDENINVCDAGDCYDLSASYFIPKDASAAYVVNSIPFDPVVVNVDGGLSQDDEFSAIIDLGFTFCYFGNASSQIVIGGNGDISFDTALTGQFDEWAFTDDVPSTNLPSGGIFGAYHDMDIGVGGSISYGVTGTAPFRAFVINYSVNQFSCTTLVSTQQIVLHETSNFIDVYITDKPTCATWNDGNAVVGIQNIGGTIGYVAPGRNTSDSPWTATNEAWRFSPDGADVPTTFEWQDNTGTAISSNTTVNVCPTADTSYTAHVEYTYCDGSTVVNEATTNITVGNASANLVDLGLDFSMCNGGPFTLTAGGAFSLPVVYEWLFDGVVLTGEITDTLTATALGTYTVNVTYGASSCTTTDDVIVSAGSLSVTTAPDLTLDDDNVDGMVSFDLTVNEVIISGGVTGYIFTYYETMADANAGTNPVISPFINTTNPDEIFVLVEDPATGCSVITSFNLYVVTPTGSCFETLPGTGTNGEYIIDCNTAPCATINTSFTDGTTTATYNVSSIAYAPQAAFNGLANSEVAGFESDDDSYSSLIDIPFTFSYFGNCYSQLVIGNNGMISFNAANADGYNDWSVQPLPYVDGFNDSYQNAIYGVHQDIYWDQPADAEISWETFGTAPNRYFVASFNNLYSYSCTSTGSTFQMVLFETTNIVEVHIETRCDIDGTVGIENGDGTVAYTAPGRNGTTWNTTNEAWRFEPAGVAPADTTITWYDGTTVIGTGANFEVCPTENTTYFVQLVDNISGDVLSDTATVLVNGINFTLNGITGDDMFCPGDDTTLTVDTTEAGLTYTWDYTDTIGTTPVLGEFGDSITVDEYGTYTATATNSYGCIQTANFVVSEDLNCILPTGFSPNNDGVNDTFDAGLLAGPVTSNGTTNIEKIEIFNRNGTSVYEKSNYRDEWDGDELPTGTYFYIMKLKVAHPVHGNMVKKWVYINREN